MATLYKFVSFLYAESTIQAPRVFPENEEGQVGRKFSSFQVFLIQSRLMSLVLSCTARKFQCSGEIGTLEGGSDEESGGKGRQLATSALIFHRNINDT